MQWKPAGFTAVTMASTCALEISSTVRYKSTGVPYSLILEWTPDNRSVSNSELGEPAARDNATFRNIECVHNRDNVVLSGTGSLHIAEELRSDQLVHVLAEVRRVQGDLTLKVV